MKLSKLLTWRTARWAVLAAAVPALWACNARRLEKPNPAPARTFNGLFQQVLNRDIDIVFMIDNSLSMQPLQKKLAANFPIFMNVLTGLPGGLPNVHIGVVSSDMGAGPYTAVDIPACRTGGDAGGFQSSQRMLTQAFCARGSLNAGQNFIIGSAGGMQANYTGNIADAFSCIAGLGDTGCGFEHQFGSILRALNADGNPAGLPAQNANFLRPNAYLGIVMITNEDDCSAPPDSQLFNPNSRFVSDQLGPLASYRCNEFGHLCGGARPPRTNIPANGTDLTGTCKSAEDGTLLKVTDVVSRIKALKPDPNKILVAAIAGPPTPYVVENGPASLKDDPIMQWPQIRHSCTQQVAMGAAPEYGDPAVRIAEFIEAFGANGVFQVICNDTFDMALQVIAKKLGALIGDPCVEGKVLDVNGNLFPNNMTPAAADCTVVDHSYNDQGLKIDTPVPSCDTSGGTMPCWTIVPGDKCGAGKFFMNIQRGGAMPPSDLNSTVSCSVRVCPPPGTPGKPADCP